MHEHPYLAELASATSTGLLAEEMVFVVSRLLREEGAQPDEADRRVLEAGRALLQSVANPKPGESQRGMSQLVESEGALETIEAAQAQAQNEDVGEYLRRLDTALEGLLGDVDFEPVATEMTSVRDLFATVGHLMLSRANRLTRSPQEQLRWLASPTTSTS